MKVVTEKNFSNYKIPKCLILSVQSVLIIHHIIFSDNFALNYA